MRNLLRSRVILAIALIFVLALARPVVAAAAPSDPFGASVLPRVLILFDSSHSMQLDPADTDGTLAYPTDDYDPNGYCSTAQGTGVCGSWGTSNSAASPAPLCRSKLCIAKKVLSQVLPQYFSTAEMGLGTYYQYTKTTTAGSTPANTKCFYDILAAPNEARAYNTNRPLTASTTLGATASCTVASGCATNSSVACTLTSVNATANKQPRYALPVPPPGDTLVVGGLTYTYDGVPIKDTNGTSYYETQKTNSAPCLTDETPNAQATVGTGSAAITWYFRALRQVPELNQTFCQYYRYDYNYYAPSYTYTWRTVGGELLGTTNVTADTQTNWCTATNEATYNSNTGFATNTAFSCSPASTTAPNCASPAGRKCYLKWRTTTSGISGNWIPPGPNNIINCVSRADVNNSGPPSNPAAKYPNEWCSGTAAGSGGATTTTLYADYYDPNHLGPSHSTCNFGFSWAATAGSGATTSTTQVETSPAADASTHSLTFVDIGSTGASSTTAQGIINALQVYHRTLNPTGIRFPLSSDFTPLWGAISNIKDYLTNTVLPNDPSAGCRSYYLIVITDGVETTPISGPLAGTTLWPNNNPLYDAVTALRTLTVGGVTVDVQTFVIGFGNGASDASLNIMAQRGGNAVTDGVLDPSCNPKIAAQACTAGNALNPSDSTQLQATLDGVFAGLTTGKFSRTRPTLTSNGNRIYEAYFARLKGNPVESQGNVDAFLVSSAGTVSTPYWQYGYSSATPGSCTDASCRINGQATRTLYTNFLDTTQTPAVLKPMGLFDPTTNATDLSHLYTEMGATTSSGLATINFVRNMDLAQNYVNGQSACTATTDCPSGLGQTCTANLCTCSSTANCPSGQVCKSGACGAPKNSRASDIYHSTPVIIGASVHADAWAGSTSALMTAYSQFKSLISGVREQTLYAGGNDGVLHAIREDGSAVPAAWAGTERWGFVPTSVLPALPLSRVSHQFLVDGDFAAEDVCFSGCTDKANWKTILVGSLRDGGPDLYALDVTDPTAPKWLWDFTHGNLGGTWSAPVIAQVNVSGTATWAVIVGAGKSDTPQQGNGFFVLNAQTGAVIQDASSNTAYFRVDAGHGCTQNSDCSSAMVCDTTTSFCVGSQGVPYPKNNVVARPYVYRPNDSPMANQAYFGDTQGRMNRVFFTEAAGDVSKLKPVRIWDPFDVKATPDMFGNATTAVKLASTNGTLTGALGAWPLPISQTTPPVYYPPVAATTNGFPLIIYGTGDSTNPTDPNSTNYLFAFRDNNTATDASGTTAWVKRFDAGEKMLGTPAIVGTAVVVGTYLPPPAGSNICQQAGTSRLYAFDAVSGNPVAVLKDPGGAPTNGGNSGIVVSGAYTSQLTLGANLGIISSLQVVGSNIVYSVSNSTTPTAIAIGNMPVTLTVKSWRRVR